MFADLHKLTTELAAKPLSHFSLHIRGVARVLCETQTRVNIQKNIKCKLTHLS